MAWVYYLLGGSKDQFSVWHGLEKPNSCGTTGTNVFLYPVEYLTYSTVNNLTTRANGQKEYKLMDHLGSTRVVLDNNGITQEYDYDPFGRQVVVTAATTGGPARESFIGKEKDGEDNLGDFGVRKYDESLGRFLSTDVLWEKYRGLTPYQYGGNNPIGASDPTGKIIQIQGLTIEDINQIISYLGVVVGGTFTYKILPGKSTGRGLKKYFVAQITGFKANPKSLASKEWQRKTLDMINSTKMITDISFVPNDEVAEHGGTGTTSTGDSKTLTRRATILIGEYYRDQTVHNKYTYLGMDGKQHPHDIYSSIAHELFGHAMDAMEGKMDAYNTMPKGSQDERDERIRLENRAMKPENQYRRRIGMEPRKEY